MKQGRLKLFSYILIVILAMGSFAFISVDNTTMEPKDPDEWDINGIRWTAVRFDESTNFLLLDFSYEYEIGMKGIKPIAYYKNPNQQIVFGIFDTERILTAFQDQDIDGRLEGVIIYGIDEDNNEFPLASYTRDDILEYVNNG